MLVKLNISFLVMQRSIIYENIRVYKSNVMDMQL